MISLLSGQIIAKTEKNITLMTQGGVGYLVTLPQTILEKLQLNQEATLNIHTHVREDDISLYGFTTPAELAFFKQLLSVSGIGPKSALEIMSAPLNTVAQAINNEDSDTLSKIPGLGKKTAQRIILELKNKILPVTTDNNGQNSATMTFTMQEEVVIALTGLGYARHHIELTLKNCPQEITETEDIVRYFLKNS